MSPITQMDHLTVDAKLNNNGSESISNSTRSSHKNVVSPVKSKRKTTSLPHETVEYLKAWMMSPQHIAHPYPTEHEKAKIMEDTGLELKQLTNWFVNNRKRYWKPRVEGRLTESATPSSATSSPRTPSILPVTFSTISLTSLVTPEGSNHACEAKVHVVEDSITSGMYSNNSTVVSDRSSLASDVVSESSDDDASDDPLENNHHGQVESTERVHVHILKPVHGGVPGLDHVSVNATVPPESVLKTFQNCSILYAVPSRMQRNKKQVASIRTAELDRLKSQCLKQYLAEVGSAKRALVDNDEPATPRNKYRRISLQHWRQACHDARHGYDDELPSLEEATMLFGFATVEP